MLTFPQTFGTLPLAAVPPYVAPAATPERVLLLSPYDSDLATMVASTEVVSLPVSNLRNQEPSKVWRTTAAVGQHVDLTFPSPVAADTAALAAYDLPAALIWRLRAYTAPAGACVVDSGWKSVWPQGHRHQDPVWGPDVALLRVDNEAAYKHWRVEFSDPAVGATHIDIGRLAVGRAVQFAINMDIEAGIGFEPNDVAEPNGYGHIFTDPRPYAQRRFEMTWSFGLAQNEANGVAMELARLRGQAGDVFCFLDPGEVGNFHRWSMQGLFSGRHAYQARPLWVPDVDGVSRQAWGFTFSLIQKL
jgi:hypothetical protein